MDRRAFEAFLKELTRMVKKYRKELLENKDVSVEQIDAVLSMCSRARQLLSKVRLENENDVKELLDKYENEFTLYRQRASP